MNEPDALIISVENTFDNILIRDDDIFETTSTDTSFYVKTAEETGGKSEITLSTCTDDASETDRRLIVLAAEE